MEVKYERIECWASFSWDWVSSRRGREWLANSFFRCMLYRFGAPYHDGYGINYLAGPDVIKFGIESKHSCSLTSTEGFKGVVSEAMREMRSLFSASLESYSSNTAVSHL